MHPDELAAILKRPEVHRRIVGSRAGPYAMGITVLPSGEAAIHVRVAESDPSGIPSEIEVDGQRVPVVAEGGFAPPVKQRP
jgi:hypothetical protein